MIDLNGDIKVFADTIDNASIGMLKALTESEIGKDAKIRIMPDVHAGSGCVIGTSMITKGKVSPILLGGDIGCGITMVRLKGKCRIDLPKLDKVIRSNIPTGMEINDPISDDELSLNIWACIQVIAENCNINKDKAKRSLGSLGGGNHFIELGVYEFNGHKEYWLTVHSGSRHLGQEVLEHFKKEAAKQHPEVPYAFAYLSGVEAYKFATMVDRHLFDYATANRMEIIRRICKAMKWSFDDDSTINCCHNSISNSNVGTADTADNIKYLLRKGCISAHTFDTVAIPLNMRDGILIGKGKSNIDWNCSAPHGAGRLMSREDARNSITLTEYKKSMDGIYSTSISRKTIDESPMAYKDTYEITKNIEDTVSVFKIVKPVYNFKPDGKE